MCARYTLRKHLAEVAQLLAARLFPGLEAQPRRYNIAPSQPVPVVAGDERGQTTLRLMRWGLVPHWAKDLAIGAKLINARIETAGEKPAFRDAMKYRRCLIPADGFYEWTAGPGQSGGRKQPYFIHRIDDGVLAFAGLWEHWQDGHGNELETCTILTTAANDTVRPLHDRMPVILDPTRSAGWMQAPSAAEALAFIQGPSEPPKLTLHPVSPRVNRPTVDDPRCVEPLPPNSTDPAGLF
jgi:putative SOS response-associated peptidase YedK